MRPGELERGSAVVVEPSGVLAWIAGLGLVVGRLVVLAIAWGSRA